MQTPNKLITLVSVLLTTTAVAEAPCDYNSKDKVVYEGSIESVRVLKKNVKTHVEDTRKCTMNIEARIKGKWYPSDANYVFGPDMSEVDACNIAEQKLRL
jgi:hypothetical protein